MSFCRYTWCKIYEKTKKTGMVVTLLGMTTGLLACGNSRDAVSEVDSSLETGASTNMTAELGRMIEKNPDVFGWLYVPGTGINYPIAQNIDGDDTYYLTHDPGGVEESDKGGIYIESANLMDMCDFNTVIHGKTTSDGDMFSELWNFADADFFKEHDQFYIFLPDNTLTYEIWTAYDAPNENILSSYDLTEEEGCVRYLEDMKNNWNSKTNFREGWDEGVDPDNFLVTLSTVDEKYPDRQWIVVGCLVGDEAGTIDRPAETEYTID